MQENELIKKRLFELAKKSYDCGYFLFTDFLGLAEQALFSEIKREISGIKYTCFGGAEGAERVMIRFGDEGELGYSESFPIVCIRVEPRAMKFADKLTHRDFLGAILNLGIDRCVVGDIVIKDNVGYVFAKEDMADFIISELSRVKHTDVKLSIAGELPEGELYTTERRKIQAVGERIDAVVAKVFSLSREESLGYFRRRLVFVDGRQMENNSYVPKNGEKISVRGLGRMIYRGYESTSKKGKLNIEVDVYV